MTQVSGEPSSSGAVMVPVERRTLVIISRLFSAVLILFPVNAMAQSGQRNSDNSYNVRLNLARQIISVTHRESHFRRIFYEQYRLSMSFCRKKTCQSDLDKAIDDAAQQSAEIYARRAAEIAAKRLSDNDLRAALQFYQSPSGQNIINALEYDTDDLAALGHSISIGASKIIDHDFCPAHPDVCAPPPEHQPAHPKSNAGAQPSA